MPLSRTRKGGTTSHLLFDVSLEFQSHDRCLQILKASLKCQLSVPPFTHTLYF